MARIVAFPQIVEQAVEQFADLFSCAPQRKHFAEYLTGLMIATRKTVNGISSVAQFKGAQFKGTGVVSGG